MSTKDKTIRFPSETMDALRHMSEKELYTSFNKMMEMLADAALQYRESNGGKFRTPFYLVNEVEYEEFKNWKRIREGESVAELQAKLEAMQDQAGANADKTA